MKNNSIIKLILLAPFIISFNISAQETKPVKADTIKFYQSNDNYPAVIKITVLSDNTFNFYMNIIDDNTIINTNGIWEEKEDYIKHTFHNSDFLITTLFDTTKYANDYTILNDSTVTFDKNLWSINIWAMWCNDILKTQ